MRLTYAVCLGHGCLLYLALIDLPNVKHKAADYKVRLILFFNIKNKLLLFSEHFFRKKSKVAFNKEKHKHIVVPNW